MLASATWKITLRKNGWSRLWTEWDAFAVSPPATQRKILSERMLDTLRFFGDRDDSLPAWRELGESASPEDVWSHWTSLPIVTKDDLRNRFDADTLQKRFDIDGRVNTSGGSTGAPTRFIWDSVSLRKRLALQYYAWTNMGWIPGIPVVCLWGSPRDLGLSTSWRAKLQRQSLGLSIIDGYEFNDRTINELRQLLESHDTLGLYGYATLLDQAAQHFLDAGYAIPPGKILTAWSGAEALHQGQSDKFFRAFGRPLHNQYGGREFGAIAYKLAGAPSFRVLRPMVFVEIVNDQNQLCAPGEIGRVLLTTLAGRGTPFIRYENGDLATYAESDLTEAGLAGMERVEGRITGMIRLPDGRAFHSVFWHQLFKEYAEIRGFHVHQDEDGALTITYVGVRLPSEREGTLRHLVENMLRGVSYRLVYVESLPRTSQGKHLQVTSDFSPDR